MLFPETRWSHVARSRGREPEAQTALSELCEGYYEPVFVFLRSEGRGEDEARELAQEFFARLLGGNGVDGAERERGRFRTFLLGAVKHFLAGRRQYEGRLKRGGGVQPEEMENAEGKAPGLSPDAAFDRQWALTVLDRTLTALAAEMEAEGQGARCAALTPFLTGSTEYGQIETAAPGLGMTPAALRVGVHRLRSRYRELLRRELAHTLAPGSSLEEELAALKAALRD